MPEMMGEIATRNYTQCGLACCTQPETKKSVNKPQFERNVQKTYKS